MSNLEMLEKLIEALPVEGGITDQELSVFKRVYDRLDMRSQLASRSKMPIVYRYFVDYELWHGGTQTHIFEMQEHKTLGELLEHFKKMGKELYGTDEIKHWGHASTRSTDGRLNLADVNDIRKVVTGEDFSHDGA